MRSVASAVPSASTTTETVAGLLWFYEEKMTNRCLFATNTGRVYGSSSGSYTEYQAAFYDTYWREIQALSARRKKFPTAGLSGTSNA